MIRWILLSAVISTSAWAKDSTTTGMNSIGVDASVEAGGIALGADYEYALKPNLGVGGYFHYFPKSTRNENPDNGYIMLGAQAVVHYVTGPFDAYAAPGFGFVNIDSENPAVSSTFTAGPRLGLGVLYQINANVAVGFEENSYWVWLASDYNGLIINDLAAKFRTTF